MNKIFNKNDRNDTLALIVIIICLVVILEMLSFWMIVNGEECSGYQQACETSNTSNNSPLDQSDGVP